MLGNIFEQLLNVIIVRTIELIINNLFIICIYVQPLFPFWASKVLGCVAKGLLIRENVFAKSGK